jgi:antitoxin (DNA-binding transcriptional repressor) of toxin-antitoxin stability system
MATVTLAEAQAKLSDLVHKLLADEEVLITEGGQVIARLVSERKALRPRPGPGLGKGMMTIVAAAAEHLNDFAEYMP